MGITLAKHVLLPLLGAGPPEDNNLRLPPADGVGPSAEVMDVSKAVLKLCVHSFLLRQCVCANENCV